MSEKLRNDSVENLNTSNEGISKSGEKIRNQKEHENKKGNRASENEHRAEVERTFENINDSQANKSAAPKQFTPSQTIIKKATKHQKKSEYKKTMSAIRSEMAPSERAFSKVIHNPVVEKVSDVAGVTIARPTSLLAGSLSAFILTALVYVVARHYGYALGGTEFIAAFVVGWIVGLVIDWLRAMISGKRIV